MESQIKTGILRVEEVIDHCLILTLPIEAKEYTIHNNAFNNGLGYVLIQNDKIIAYTSRPLKPYKNNYLTHYLELVVMVFALKIWRHYLYEMPCKIDNDHKILKNIFT